MNTNVKLISHANPEEYEKILQEHLDDEWQLYGHPFSHNGMAVPTICQQVCKSDIDKIEKI